MAGIRSVSLLLSVLTLPVARADTGTDSNHQYAWGENVGWASAQSVEHNVTIHYDEVTGGWLSGHVWGENIGWIVMGSAGGGPYANTAEDNPLAAQGQYLALNKRDPVFYHVLSARMEMIFISTLKAMGAYCVPPRASRFEVTNCDLKNANSSGVSTNMKLSGKRPALRLTACLSALVGTP
jgi:hypothetical protein